MVKIENDTFEIVIEERFSFECQALPRFEDIKNEVRYLYDNGEINEDDIDGVKEFLEHELTDDDKLQILEYIKDDYEYESCNPEYEVSIFDEDRIRKSINDWIEGNFEFRPDEP